MNIEALLGRVNPRLASVWRAAAARGPHMSHPWTGRLVVLFIVAGVVLRIQNVGYPFHYGFDESQYVGAAHQFLIGVSDTGECCHPPLSKLLIGTGLLAFGNNPMGWRFIPLCFGLQNMLLVFWLANSLFRDRRAGWLAAAFMAADGFFLTYSRAALPDMILASSILWSLLAAVTARSWAGVLACGVLVGLAASIKWVGLLVGLPACVAILLLRRVPWYSLVSFAVVPLVHLGVWMLGLALIGQPYDPLSVWAEMMRRKNIHLGFVHGVNPLESAWYTWLVFYHPIAIKTAQLGTQMRVAYSAGNPVLWVAGDVCLVALPILGAGVALNARWRARWKEWFDAGYSKGLAIIGIAWVSMMLLWFTGRITTYWYHYLTPWGITLVLLGGVFARLERRYPKEVLTFVVLVGVALVYFAPVWAEFPISSAAAQRRMISTMGWW